MKKNHGKGKKLIPHATNAGAFSRLALLGAHEENHGKDKKLIPRHKNAFTILKPFRGLSNQDRKGEHNNPTRKTEPMNSYWKRELEKLNQSKPFYRARKEMEAEGTWRGLPSPEAEEAARRAHLARAGLSPQPLSGHNPIHGQVDPDADIWADRLPSLRAATEQIAAMLYGDPGSGSMGVPEASSRGFQSADALTFGGTSLVPGAFKSDPASAYPKAMSGWRHDGWTTVAPKNRYEYVNLGTIGPDEMIEVSFWPDEKDVYYSYRLKINRKLLLPSQVKGAETIFVDSDRNAKRTQVLIGFKCEEEILTIKGNHEVMPK